MDQLIPGHDRKGTDIKRIQPFSLPLISNPSKGHESCVMCLLLLQNRMISIRRTFVIQVLAPRRKMIAGSNNLRQLGDERRGRDGQRTWFKYCPKLDSKGPWICQQNVHSLKVWLIRQPNLKIPDILTIKMCGEFGGVGPVVLTPRQICNLQPRRLIIYPALPCDIQKKSTLKLAHISKK